MLTLLLLFAPVFTITRNETQKPLILLLQDNSRSIANALGKDSAVYQKNVEDLSAKLSEKYKVVQWGFGNTVQTENIFQYKQPATDISAALARAQEYYGLQNLGAIILATDGRFNQGLNPLYQQLSLHNPIYTVAIGDSVEQKDIRVIQVYANKVVSLNSQFEIRTDIVAALCKGYNNSVQLSEAGNLLSAAPITVNADKYDRSVSFTIKAATAGLHHYIITVPAADGEKNLTNNRHDVFVEVQDEKKNILILSASPHPDVNAIKDALAGLETYKVTIKTVDHFPSSLNEYSAIVLHGLPSVNFNIAQQISASRKPIWFILGNQSSPLALSNMQKMVSLNINPAAQHDVAAAYNSSFSAFTLPQNTAAVLDKMPPLSVPTGIMKASPDALVLFNQKLAGDGDMPLWIFQQGAVPMAMLAGEGIWRWRLYEFKNFNKHDVVDECIRQTLAFLTANNTDKPFRVSMPKQVWSDQEAISLNAYLLDANNEQVNTPDAKIIMTDSAGHKQNFSFERAGNAYRLNLGVWAGGTYTYSAQTSYNDKTYTANGSFVVESIPLEFMETGADYPLLYGMAKKYNGALVPAGNVGSLYDSITHNEHIKPVIQTITDTIPLIDRKWYFFLILLVAVTEWLLRKYWLAQ